MSSEQQEQQKRILVEASSPESHPETVSPVGSPTSGKNGRASRAVDGVRDINHLESENVELDVAPETQKTGWKINTSPNSIDEPAYLKILLVRPPVKKITLQFPLGLVVTARNLKGVTIKDAFDAIYKIYKKKTDDEVDEPYLTGFEWKPESWTKLIVHTHKNASPAVSKKRHKGSEE